MRREINITNFFNAKKEDGQNPFTGFSSFQHFRGEKLYSDIVVKPENNFTETENVECFPVPSYVPENGREEGYYPDTSVSYIRILWKEFEPIRGEYNYGFIEDILNEARRHNQTVAFRLMAHSTREEDDVPSWLKEIMDCPLRPAGKRVKDSPTDRRFLILFGEAIKALGERFDDDETLDSLDISLPGAWGEGHKLELYPDEDIKKLYDIYVSAFKKTRLVTQLGRADIARSLNSSLPIGLRGDGLGAPFLLEKYKTEMEALSEEWKKAPISFESYWWIGEWMRQGWDIDDIIECTLNWHISSFNAKSIPAPYEWKDKIDYWVSKMGYHYEIKSFSCPDEADSGDDAEFILKINNSGVAPIYRNLPLLIRLGNEDAEYTFTTDVDITKWMPGESVSKFYISLPHRMKKGSYNIEIGIFKDNIPPVYFATDACRCGNFYKVGKMEVK